MASDSDPIFKKTWGTPPTHTIKESDEVAHKALELAEKLEEKMLVNPLKYLGSEKGKSWLGVYLGGILAVSCLIGAAVMLSNLNNQKKLGSTEDTFLVGGLILGSAIGLGIYFMALSSVEFLGNNISFISIFLSTLALGLGIFMMIVAVKSRTLPG
jgi:hypothetical protein